MNPQDQLRQKRIFFDSLYALDESDSEEPDVGLQGSSNALKGTDKPNIANRGAALDPILTTRQPVTRTLSMPSAIGTRQPSKVPTFQSRHTFSSEASHGLHEQASDPKATATANIETRSEPRVAEISRPLTGRLFDGLHFYFFPNNDKSPSRKIRIKKALEFGAIWDTSLTADVTHIIVDRSMNYGQVMTFLRIDALPPNVYVVDERYPADCISFKTVLNPGQRQYRVNGMPDLVQPTSQPPRTLNSSAKSDVSLQLKPAGKYVTTRQVETPPQRTASPIHAGTVSSIHTGTTVDTASEGSSGLVASEKAICAAHQNSELDSIIDETRKLQHMPLDPADEPSRPSSSDSKNSESEEPPTKKVMRDNPKWQDKFQCMQKHTGKNEENPNSPTIALLEEMAEYYAQIKDQWRPIAYRKAIAQLRNHPTKISTKEDALKLHFVGERLAEKIEEIVYTNHLRRLDSARAEPTDKVIQLFLKIYGVGFAQASNWVDQGFRTLDDLRQTSLTDNQLIGLEHYDDFDTRIPRAEVEQHAFVVRNAARGLDTELQVITMGSYRRGAETSGDIDLIVTHPHMDISQIRTIVTEQLVPHLFANDFLKASLASTSRVDGTKWHGASCLPGRKIWRRIDFLLVPLCELGAALIYFTGNDIFNRSMRLLASRKGMRLNQRGLYKECLRGKAREKLTEGELVEGKDEKRIFAALGVPWRPAEHRIC